MPRSSRAALVAGAFLIAWMLLVQPARTNITAAAVKLAMRLMTPSYDRLLKQSPGLTGMKLL